MAIVTSGDFLISPTVGIAKFGIDAPGSLTVEDGSNFVVEDLKDTGSGILSFGDNAEGVGTGHVTGNGSRLSVLGGVAVAISRMGTGELTVDKGGAVEVNAPLRSAALAVAAEGPGNGTLIVDAATFDLSGVFAFAYVGTLGGDGSVVIRNGGAMTLSAEQSYFELSNGDGKASLSVLSGGSLTIEGDPFENWPTLSIAASFGASQAAVVVSGPGSVVDAGSSVEIGRQPLSFEGQAGSLTIDDGGTFRVGIGWIGKGGTLIGGDGTLIVEGADLDLNSGLDIAGGTLRLLSGGGPLSVQGIVSATSFETSLVFEVAADGSSNGALSFEGGRFAVTNGAAWRVSPLGGYEFVAGESFVLVQGTAATAIYFRPWEGGFDFSVDGQDAGFAYTYALSGQSIRFTAINNGDGTGARDLQFADAGSPETWFRYDSDFGTGTGWSGSPENGGIAAVNVTALSGTSGVDNFLVVADEQAMSLHGLGGDDFLAGGGGDDTVSGGIGEDWVVGGDGADTLTGGADADKFLLGPFFADPDVITDFQPGEDAIVVLADALEGMEWADLYPVMLLAENFASNAAGVAEDDDDRIIYGTETGRVIYDSNGSEVGGEIHIATLAPGLDVAHNDFFFALG